MAILTNAGRAAVAKAIKDQEIHLAWGSGDVAWDTTPVPEPTDATALVAEVGRRRVSEVQYCVPDAAGEIVVPPGRFTVSATPTKYLYMRFSFDFEDAPSAVIRELAIFIGTQLQGSVPPGQEYLEPADVLDPGQILTLERIYRMERSPTIRQRFEFVIQF